MFSLVKALIVFSRLIDLILDEVAKLNGEADIQRIRDAIRAAKAARSEEAKRDAAKALSEAFGKR